MTTMGRRALLTSAVLVPLAACAKRPRLGTASGSNAPTASARGAGPGTGVPAGPSALAAAPLEALSRAWGREAAQAAWLDAVASGAASWKATASVVRWCRATAACHRAHADWLAALGATPVPLPARGPALPTGVPAMRAEFGKRETQISVACQLACKDADQGWLALAYASLAAAARASATLGPAPVPTTAQPAPFERGDRASALSVLVSHLNALIYALQTGLGVLPAGNANRKPGEARLDEVLSQRDAVTARLRSANGTPPPFELSYPLPGRLATPSEVTSAWGAGERAVLDAWGGVVASSTGADRTAALGSMLVQATRPAAWGTPVTWWPGWRA